ncbi:LSMT-L [Symbiodinium necroappetens]|uniref:LSMT-L protein n=1 Tax=Symbiodinium necroappetens TaxID=1628268 RepID=A0A812YSM9_9DINO|nr:LSMT-L [Symbiodinium necroappetens]
MTMLQLALLGSLCIPAAGSEDCHDQAQVGLMQLKTSRAFDLDREAQVSSWGKSSPKTPAPSTQGATPADTVRQFCNATGLLDMHGALQNGGDAAQSSMEEIVLQSVAQSVEVNNVDKVAKDMPDSVFWHLARQELAADLLEAVVDKQKHVEQAIAELYQTYKFVPLLCSNNINVFDEKDPQDHTYFKAFEGRISRLMKWLDKHGNGTVAQKLASADEIFCGSANMNEPSCGRKQKFDEWMNRMTSGFGSWQWDAASSEEKWSAMASIFASFGSDAPGTPDWTKDMKTWKTTFPYHSFVSKQSGMPSASSPSSKQRFLACFGKRVASELHRRPSGRYVLTDQNNLGCHGFWDAEELTDMLERTVALWRPPTCQMALMTYDIKRKILLMYSQMSKTLFKALPSMVNDEELSERGLLTSAVEGPGPFDPSQVIENAVHYVDGMRVKAKAALRWPVGCEPSWFTSTNACELEVEEGEYGTVQNTQGKLAVVWDQDEKSQRRLVRAKDLAVVPRGWGPSKTLSSRAWDMVSGIGSSISSTAESLVASLYSPRQTRLAQLFSGSVSKWIVCPIRNDADLEALDSQLGVEDPAMQDLQEEAYSSWTGHSAAVSGQSCTTPSFDAAQFPKSQSCEISELHSDHPEKYTQNGVAEPFLCPAKALLPASEQLDVLLAKRGQCFLHMTSEQLRHYQWMHNGDFPARRQYDRKPNLPRVEYELIKLLRVPQSGAGEVSYARSCSPEAMQRSPRFCRATRFHNKWATLTEIASILGSAAVGSVAMGTASITMTLSSYGQILSKEGSAGEKIKESATYLGEDLWDSLTGAGRLMTSAATSAVNSVAYELPGSKQRQQRMEDEIFQTADAALLLHSLSFQDSIGSSGHTSNSKERYQRYVVTMPCEDFDPALEYSTKELWSRVVLKMIQSAFRNGLADALSTPVPKLTLRGESRLFLRENSKIDDSDWLTYGASVTLQGASGEALAKCSTQSWWACSGQCERSGLSCVPKDKVSTNGFWRTADPTLISTVAPSSLPAATDTNVYGISVSFYCGAKKSFKDDGSGPSSGPLLQCLKEGVKTNAHLRAASPWKLYFPDEVMVLAIFSSLEEAQCTEVPGAPGKLCSGATKVPDLDAHLIPGDKKSTDGVYQGTRSGSGFPKGTPYEITLRPEDLLEAAGILQRL